MWTLSKKWAYLLVIAVLISCNSTGQQSTEEISGIKIYGTVGYPKARGIILLEEVLTTNQIGTRDTIFVNEKDYTYSYRKQITTPGIYRLNFYGLQLVNILLDDEDIEVNVDGNARNGFVQITGSTDHQLLDEFQVFNSGFQRSEEMQKINMEFQQAQQQGNATDIAAVRTRYAKMEEAHNAALADKILDMGTSLAALQVINTLDKDKHFPIYLAVAKKFNALLPDNEFVKQFVQQVENMKLLAIGQIAPDIALPNPNGEVIKLSSFRGKYVLVDFWAKWCRPCRIENPNVVSAYNKYNKKGFEVFGVSLDRKKEDWIKAIQEDGLRWTQVSDLKYWQSEAARLYNVKGIPFAVLLDKEGRIIAKNLRGQQLHDKLAELMGE